MFTFQIWTSPNLFPYKSDQALRVMYLYRHLMRPWWRVGCKDPLRPPAPLVFAMLASSMFEQENSLLSSRAQSY